MTENLLFNICQQRRRAQLFAIPPTRAELEDTPYNNPSMGIVYTQYDIDMRRKAEILKYSSNKVSTQTNSLTKNEKFSLLVRGFSQSIPLASANESTIQRACPNDAVILTPTSSSDVPGPVIMLFDNESVPLYKYINPTYTRNYSSLPENNTYPWSIEYNENIQYTIANEYKTFSSIYIRESVTQPLTTFQLNIPISIYVSGSILNTGSNNSISIRISDVNFVVFYNDTDVTTSYSNTAPTIVKNLTDLSFNVNEKTGLFSASQYVGNLSINNITLGTTIGSVYDLKLSFNYTISSGNQYTVLPYLKQINYGVYANTTNGSITLSDNCNVTSIAATSYSKGSITEQK
jgi:hypothetical protein